MCRWPQFVPLGDTVADGWYYALPWLSERSGAPRDMYLKLEPIDYDAMLATYSPQLQYDSQELYFSDSVGVITDSDLGDPNANYLRSADGGVISETGLCNPIFCDLDVSYLRDGFYPDGTPVNEGDYLDEDDDYHDTASLMHDNPAYGNRVYGRAVHDGDGARWLQYWMFYYYNDLSFVGIGVHEGDWEIVQIKFSGATPTKVVLAQHVGAQSCPWTALYKVSGTSIPKVFVGRGSHAAFPAPGTWTRAVLPDDQADGVIGIRPALEIIRSSSPDWVRWPGRYGASAGGGLGSESPKGPRFQGKWAGDAIETLAGSNECPMDSGGQAISARKRRAHARAPKPGPRPRAPKFTASRQGDRIVVRYRLAPGGRRATKAAYLFATSSPRNIKKAPAGRRQRVRGARGTISLAMPDAAGPYTIRLQAYARNGARSKGAPRVIR